MDELTVVLRKLQSYREGRLAPLELFEWLGDHVFAIDETGNEHLIRAEQQATGAIYAWRGDEISKDELDAEISSIEQSLRMPAKGRDAAVRT